MTLAEKWTAGSLGSGLTWVNAFSSSTLDALGSGESILSDLSFANGSNLDIYADVSVSLPSKAFTTPNYLGIYIYPLNKDGSTYGDGRFGTAGAGEPPSNYRVGVIGLVAATQAQEGSTKRPILLPPGTFKFVLFNNAGFGFETSGNSCQARFYNRSLK